MAGERDRSVLWLQKHQKLDQFRNKGNLPESCRGIPQNCEDDETGVLDPRLSSISGQTFPWLHFSYKLLKS